MVRLKFGETKPHAAVPGIFWNFRLFASRIISVTDSNSYDSEAKLFLDTAAFLRVTRC